MFESGAVMIDLHCHILPGLDDGSPDLATSLEIAHIALNDGIETIVATPHWFVDAGPTPAQIRTAVQQLQAALVDHNLPLTVLPGAEVRADPELAAMIRRNAVMTLADRGEYLLLEPPFIGVPNYLEQLCFELQIAGITPILAHPERAEIAQHQPELYERLVARGCLIQVNAPSLHGEYGRTIAEIAADLIRRGLAHIVASDAHNATSRPPVLSDVRQAVVQAAGEDAFRKMTELVPSRIIAGRQAGDSARTVK